LGTHVSKALDPRLRPLASAASLLFTCTPRQLFSPQAFCPCSCSPRRPTIDPRSASALPNPTPAPQSGRRRDHRPSPGGPTTSHTSLREPSLTRSRSLATRAGQHRGLLQSAPPSNAYAVCVGTAVPSRPPNCCWSAAAAPRVTARSPTPLAFVAVAGSIHTFGLLPAAELSNLPPASKTSDQMPDSLRKSPSLATVCAHWPGWTLSLW